MLGEKIEREFPGTTLVVIKGFRPKESDRVFSEDPMVQGYQTAKRRLDQGPSI